MSSNVFANMDNPEAAHVLLETTAGDARAQALGPGAAEQIYQNVDRVHTAAQDAANVAKVKGPELTGEPTSAVEQLQAGASHVTTNATLQGERDVESVKAAGANILDQVKNIAVSTVAAVQSYLPESMVGQSAKQYAQAAQDTVQSQMERIKGRTQGLTGTTDIQGAPLESGSHTTPDSTYPANATAKT